MALALTQQNFNEVINSGKVILVDFWAEWCMPCKMIAPFVEELAKEMDSEKVTITKCDVQSEPSLAAQYSITSIPSILFFKDGEVMDQIVGVVPKKTLEEKINALL